MYSMDIFQKAETETFSSRTKISQGQEICSCAAFKGIYQGFTLGGRPETAKLSYLNATNFN